MLGVGVGWHHRSGKAGMNLGVSKQLLKLPPIRDGQFPGPAAQRQALHVAFLQLKDLMNSANEWFEIQRSGMQENRCRYEPVPSRSPLSRLGGSE